MKFNSITIVLFSILFIINIIFTYGAKMTFEEERSIEMIIDEFFVGEKESCKNEYRYIEKLLIENEGSSKEIQDYLEKIKVTTCSKNSVGYQFFTRELYDMYRKYSMDSTGKKCSENAIQQHFDKFGVCKNSCFVKTANYLYVLKNYLQTHLPRNQVELIETCSKVSQANSASNKTITKGLFYLPFIIYLIFSIIF